MILVCNTGPLIALAKIDRLSLLQERQRLERILIAPMVQARRWLGNRRSEAQRYDHHPWTDIIRKPPRAIKACDPQREVVDMGNVDMEPEYVGGQR